MTHEEIFSKIATHMIEGIMMHDEMARAYDFLGLYGFSACHNNQHIEETKNYIHLSHYYSIHFHKLINLGQVPDPKIIPDTWYKYTTDAVDNGTKSSAVKEMMNKWVEWEQKTCKLYGTMRMELCNIGEIAAALKLEKLLLATDKELTHARKKLQKLETMKYDIGTILSLSSKEEKHK